jgi:hypothetical protein
MRSSEECRKRAAECLKKADQCTWAHPTKMQDERRQWHDLSKMWLVVADDRMAIEYRETLRSEAASRAASRPADLVRPNGAIEIADVLRGRLALDDKPHDER